MLLKTVFIRFYRSFNYDYLRKHHIDAPAKAKPWENVENAFFPYVRIPIDSHDGDAAGRRFWERTAHDKSFSEFVQ
jgi:hypothetical protein